MEPMDDFFFDVSQSLFKIFLPFFSHVFPFIAIDKYDTVSENVKEFISVTPPSIGDSLPRTMLRSGPAPLSVGTGAGRQGRGTVQKIVNLWTNGQIIPTILQIPDLKKVKMLL